MNVKYKPILQQFNLNNQLSNGYNNGLTVNTNVFTQPYNAVSPYNANINSPPLWFQHQPMQQDMLDAQLRAQLDYQRMYAMLRKTPYFTRHDNLGSKSIVLMKPKKPLHLGHLYIV